VPSAVIINPRSGRGRKRPVGDVRAALADRVISRANAEAEVVVTREPGHALALARRFVESRYERVIAWGGDGTVNEVAGALVGSEAVLGIVPSGSGDGLARGLGLPLRPERALGVALEGAPAPLDVGFLGDRHFLNIAGIGFDATVGREFNRRGLHGAFSYLSYAASLVWSYAPVDYRLRLDDDKSTGPRFVVAFANACQYGNGLVLSVDADPADGWLDSVVVDDGPAWRQVWRVRRLAIGKRRPTRGLHRRRVRHASITGHPLVCHVDGETFETSGTLDVGLRPGALRVAGLRRS
jgi:YegS/Rv2252/BmrU family lipid kinase